MICIFSVITGKPFPMVFINNTGIFHNSLGGQKSSSISVIEFFFEISNKISSAWL